MSKMDALRAMREAKYEAARSRATTPAAAPARPAPAAKAAKAGAKPAGKPAVSSPHDDELCGHKNMAGRTCMRERGHAAKSHRYS